MKPIGPLMREHRLIERMVVVLAKQFDPNLIPAAVDFFRTYADRTHHGKEEEILFRALARKPLSPKDSQIMRELIEEHVVARKMVKGLLDAHTRYSAGKMDSPDEVLALVRQLVDFYPRHILKEDRDFFFPCLEYLAADEQAAMLEEFWEFDRRMIHEKYQKVVDAFSSPLP